MKSVYYTLLLDFPKSGKFQSSSRMQQTVDAREYVYSVIASARALNIDVFTHILREASASLLIQRRWAYQSLGKWDEQLVWLSRFFVV